MGLQQRSHFYLLSCNFICTFLHTKCNQSSWFQGSIFTACCIHLEHPGRRNKLQELLKHQQTSALPEHWWEKIRDECEQLENSCHPSPACLSCNMDLCEANLSPRRRICGIWRISMLHPHKQSGYPPALHGQH